MYKKLLRQTADAPRWKLARFAANGQFLVAIDSHGNGLVFAVRGYASSGQPTLTQLELPPTSTWRDFAFRPENRQQSRHERSGLAELAVSTVEGVVRLSLCPATGEVMTLSEVNLLKSTAVAYGPVDHGVVGSEVLVGGNADGVVKVWRMNTAQPRQIYHECISRFGIKAAAVGHTGEHLHFVTADGDCLMLDRSGPKSLRNALLMPNSFDATSIACHPQKALVTFGGTDGLVFVSYNQHTTNVLRTGLGRIHSVEFAAMRTFTVYGETGLLMFDVSFDMEAGRLRPIFELWRSCPSVEGDLLLAARKDNQQVVVAAA